MGVFCFEAGAAPGACAAVSGDPAYSAAARARKAPLTRA
jgi:hypothetical protein